MKTDEPRDDEILGRALSRAIETSEVSETPYDRSRIGSRPVKRGASFWRVAALAAAIVVAGALGSTLLERPATDQPAGQQPTPTVAAHTPAVTTTPVPTPTPQPTAIDHQVVYFARDGLPPVGVHVRGVGDQRNPLQTTAVARITSRLAVVTLNSGLEKFPDADPVPSGAFNAIRPPNQANAQGVGAVRVDGDTATVDLSVRNDDWGIRGSALTLAALQQLVYTATEEPGVRRVLFTQNGGKPLHIDQFVMDKPLAREDVSGYGPQQDEVVGEGQSRPCAPTCPSPSPAVLSNNYSVDTFAAGVARFIVQVDSGDWDAFTVSGKTVDDTKDPAQSKYQIVLEVRGTERKPGLEVIDRSPLRSIRSTPKSGSTTYELALDDHRPWRVALLPNPDRIVVDIGGFATSLSDTVAVYSPKPGDTVRQFTVSGLSRTFEATTAWRVVDSARRVLANGFTQASRGTSAVWGTFQMSIDLSSVSGNVTLEVFWASPRDGADTGLVQIPLTVR
ncbi:MAG TPA: Gmad2 immunoglobulin-like domain-containing protein [Candidatus Limnocylindria bacterium]